MQYHFMDELWHNEDWKNNVCTFPMLVCGAYAQIGLQTGYRSYGYGGLGNYGSYYKLLKAKGKGTLIFLMHFQQYIYCQEYILCN